MPGEEVMKPGELKNGYFSFLLVRSENSSLGTSLVVQWLRPHASTTGGKGSIPGQGSFTCCVVWPKKERKQQP